MNVKDLGLSVTMWPAAVEIILVTTNVIVFKAMNKETQSMNVLVSGYGNKGFNSNANYK